jgi:hypothetical protein
MDVAFTVVAAIVVAYWLGVLTGRLIWGPPLEPPSDSK